MNATSIPRQKFAQTSRPSKPAWLIGQEQAKGAVSNGPAPLGSAWVTSAVQGQPRRVVELHLPVRKVVAGLAIFLGALFMLGLGAMVGSQQPDSTTVATLHYAQSHAPAGQSCAAVWLDGSDHWAVECGSIGR